MNMPARSHRSVVIWLGGLCVMVVGMVVIGGITRLTGSGLSIVEWKPIMGAIPPLSERDWMEAFARYRTSPQYRLINAGMTLPDFKAIFFWEYIHRLLGRLIGVAFVVPWLYFLIRGTIDRKLAWRLTGGFILGGLQGALGWFMVKSGLVDQPSVSHLRLAAHLVLALLVLGYLLWMLLDLISPAPRPEQPGLRIAYRCLAALVILQIIYGAFTAGLKAGSGFNTFPTMNGEWVPSGLAGLVPAWTNMFNNRTTIQFIHRSFAWLLLASTLGLWLLSRMISLRRVQRRSIDLLSGLVTAQFALGVMTLLLFVPVSLAVLHQLVACLVFMSVVAVNHSLSALRT